MILLALGGPDYDTTTLDAGRVDKVLARDLNGDGKPDLLLQSGRDLQIFLYQKGFAARPHQKLRFGPTVYLWTIEGGAPPVLLTAGSRGVQAHPFTGSGFAEQGDDLAVHPSAFEGFAHDGAPPALVDFAPDLDKDGRAEILLFREEEIFVMKRHADRDYRCVQKIPLDADVVTALHWSAHQKVRETTAVPLLGFGDVDGDGLTDISYYRDESMGVFRQRADGRFTSLESHDLVTHKQKRRSRRFIQYDLPPRVGDFNLDGLLDLAVIYPTKGRVHVYYGRAGRTDFSVPDDVLKIADGWTTGIYVEDLNGDRKSDLIMGVVRKFGITEGIRVFISGKVSLELHVYPMEAGGRFARDPVQELSFSIKFTFEMTRESGSLDVIFRPNFQGDFNRDGLRDLLVSSDDGKSLDIYPGVRDRGIDKKSSGSIPINPPEGVATTDAFVADFNQDGVSDLVLKHAIVEKGKHLLEIKLSK